MIIKENYIKHPFQDKFRKVNRLDIPTGVYKGQFVEQVFTERKIGSVNGFKWW
jgi:hypothetical protein